MINKEYGLVISDSNEISFITDKLSKEVYPDKFIFYNYKINNNINLRIVESGVGMIKATMATQKLIDKFPKIKAIFNIGAVGANDSSLNIHDLVVPDKIYFGDVETPWYKYGQIPQMKVEYFKNLITSKDVEKAYPGIHLTSHRFVNTKKMAEAFTQHIKNIRTFDMELAAIALVADYYCIPFGSIRCVSDRIGDTDVKNIETINNRIAEAGEKSFETLINYLIKNSNF